MCLNVDNCCCCFSLEWGTKAIGILFTLTSVCTVLVYAPLAVMSHSLPHVRLIFYATLAVLAVFEIFIGGLLIHGAFKRKPHFTWPWLVLAWWKGLVLMLLTVAGLVLLTFSRDVDTIAEASAVISVYFVYSAILIYFAVVVNSRRQEMVHDNYWANKHMLKSAKTQYYYV
ncbi:uncharacterized protein LOC113495780 [Trichoplusia ni]|uniref:Uncharacterized protein LOC113495780 n=1 Tax=Trichoplusia ni TaxID=7111 RepID=A0A7E5VQA9_TRINI|nr:uncharacterized protein LOC113495780 [Trichoplusia ni]